MKANKDIIDSLASLDPEKMSHRDEMLNSILQLIGRGLSTRFEDPPQRNPDAAARWREKHYMYAFVVSAHTSLLLAYRAAVHAGINDDTLGQLSLALAALSITIKGFPVVDPDKEVLEKDG